MEFIRELPRITISAAPTEPIILECELSKRPKEPVKWYKNGRPMPSRLPAHVAIEEEKGQTRHRLALSTVTDEDIGEYSVKVEKISTTGSIDMKLAPVLRLSDEFHDSITLKAGASTVIEIPFVAIPKPTVKWTWRSLVEGSVETSPRFSPETAVAGMTSIPLGKVKREDAGDYRVVISNELGEVSVTVRLIVMDKPSTPRNLEILENLGDHLVLTWQEPEYLGDSPGSVLEYIVEMRETAMRSNKPVIHTTDLKTTVERLQIDKSYIFCVAAKNSVGQSDFVESKPVSTKLSFGK